MCEADNFIVEDFKEIFSLDKFTLFALCNNGSKIDKSLPGGEYLNAGFAYFPLKILKNISTSKLYKKMNTVKHH